MRAKQWEAAERELDEKWAGKERFVVLGFRGVADLNVHVREPMAYGGCTNDEGMGRIAGAAELDDDAMTGKEKDDDVSPAYDENNVIAMTFKTAHDRS